MTPIGACRLGHCEMRGNPSIVSRARRANILTFQNSGWISLSTACEVCLQKWLASFLSTGWRSGDHTSSLGNFHELLQQLHARSAHFPGICAEDIVLRPICSFALRIE